MSDGGAKPLGTTYARLLPPLSTAEREALAASIAAEGVRVPILVDEDGEIIEGRHRHEIDPDCPRTTIRGLKTPAEKKAAAIRFNLARRNMTPEQRDELALTQRGVALELLAEGNTQETIATMLGVSRPTVTRWIAAAEGNDVHANNVSEPKPDCRVKLGPRDRELLLRMVEDGARPAQAAADFGISERRANQVVAAERRVAESERRAEEDARTATRLSKQGHVVAGDFRERGHMIADDSVDLVFTDPPYDRESIPLYGELAEFAARVLVDGGSLVAFAGNYAVPDVLPLLGEHLTYWWTISLAHTHGNRTLPGKFVHVGWKPLLWFVKGKSRMSRRVVRDIIQAGDGGPGYDKAHKRVYHEWGQGEREAAYYVDNLACRRGLVVDPFLGGGTTGACAVRLGRRFVGFELDPEVARRAAGRIAAARAEGAAPNAIAARGRP